MGEASHPGPRRCRDEDEALDNLEFALTMIDSDDDPLGDLTSNSSAPRKRLRIRMGRASQATTVVSVESSEVTNQSSSP